MKILYWAIKRKKCVYTYMEVNHLDHLLRDEEKKFALEIIRYDLEEE